jgi:hypothetical protein
MGEGDDELLEMEKGALTNAGFLWRSGASFAAGTQCTASTSATGATLGRAGKPLNFDGD